MESKSKKITKPFVSHFGKVRNICVCVRGTGREATYCRVRRGDTGRAIAQRRKITTTRDEINELTEKCGSSVDSINWPEAVASLFLP